MPVALGVLPTETDGARLFLDGADPACGDALGIPRFPASAGAKWTVREGEKAEVGKRDAERSEDESQEPKERVERYREYVEYDAQRADNEGRKRAGVLLVEGSERNAGA